MNNIETVFISELAKILEVLPEKIDPHANFADQGLDSLNALRLCRKVRDRIDVDIELEWMFDYPSIAELAQFLANSYPGIQLVC